MGKAILYVFAAITAYLVGGINPAIVLSKLIYKKDIRTLGSKNPGFTNFKRVFGKKYAWLVFGLDLFKSALLCCVFGPVFSAAAGSFSLGAAYVGLFAMIGHAFPIWYGFKGGKGFLVGLSTVYVIDWRVGLIATLIMIVLLFTTKYMSLSTVTAMLCCPILLALFGAARPTVLIEAATVLFIALRHKENFKRLVAGTESKFALGSH